MTQLTKKTMAIIAASVVGVAGLVGGAYVLGHLCFQQLL